MKHGAEQRSLNPVRAGKQAHLTIGNRTAAVVMRMQRNNQIFPPV